MKHFIFVSIIGALYAASLYIKDLDLQRKKGVVTPTTFAIRSKTGTPVVTTKVERREFSNFVIVTGQATGSRIEASVAPQIAAKIKSGAVASIRLDEEKIYGNVTSINRKVNYLSGLNSLTVSFGNKKIKPSLYVMEIESTKLPRALVLKREAVSQRGGIFHVYLVNKDRTIRRQDVEIEGSNELYYAISSGLKAGDEVVLSDLRYLNNGEKINVVKVYEEKTK